MPHACSPMYKNTSTAPIKPDAKPIGTPIDILLVLLKVILYPYYFNSLDGSYCFSFGFLQSIIKLFTD